MTYEPRIFPTAMPWSEDSLASRFLSLADEPLKTILDGSGLSSSESFATYDPDTSSWRTYQDSLLPEWETYSETWPQSGMTRSGKAFRLPRLVPPIAVTESSLWPTPTAHHSGPDVSSRKKSVSLATAAARSENGHAQAVENPGAPGTDSTSKTATTSKTKQRTRSTSGGGPLNPEWVEWLMGFPAGWTDCQDSEKP